MKKEYLLSQLNIKAFYTNLVPSLKASGGSKAIGLCPFHNDHNPSLHIDLDNGKWKCFVCDIGGSLFDFYMKLKGVDFPAALNEIAEMQGISEEKVKQKVVATYEYRDDEGNVLYKKERVEPGRDGRKKEFFSKHFNGDKWVNGRGGKSVLYNLPEVIKSDYIIFAEGEGKADLLNKWGLTSTSLDSGANSKWLNEYTELMNDKEEVIILPDNDIPGKSFTRRVAGKLYGKVKSLKVVDLPDLKKGEDIVDWANTEGNDIDRLYEIIKEVPEWAPKEEEDDFILNLESWNYIQSLDIKVEWVVDRLIPKESISVIFGKGGIGKTWLLMDISRCIGSGIPFMGLDTIKTPVIYIDFENPLAVLNERTQKLGDCENVHFWRVGNEKIKPPKLDSPEWTQYKSLPKGAVLIFDTLRSSQSQDENASDKMGIIMERLKELRDLGFTIIILHHTSKNSDKVAKGSTAIVDLTDHILGLIRVKRGNNGDDKVLDDDSEDEDAVYYFGVKDKTRYDLYHIHLTLNPDRGFELAPDPQEETLKEMLAILKESGELNKTAFINECHQRGIASKNKLTRLVTLGQGRLWDIEKQKENNAMIVKPKNRFSGFSPLYMSGKPINLPDGTSTEHN
jgi:putative DNA primase/helicase